MSDFYVGYLPKAPAALARRTRRSAAVLVVLGAVLALILVVAQQPFAASAFEFMGWRDFEGTLGEHPYPMLEVAQPGGTESRYLLVAPGKHGAADLIRGLDGRRVRLRAQLIYREQHTMLEVEPESIQVLGEGRVAPPAPPSTSEFVTVTGEIVDTKCYFGVMNPGRGKVHRDCAARCVSGGLPPALVDDRGDVYLLVDAAGRALAPDGLEGFAGEPVSIHGELKNSSRLVLAVTHIQRTSR